MKNKILLIFGTRPEAIKLAPLACEISKHNVFDLKICVTGQHREMLDQVLSVFNIKPDYDLNIMRASQDLTDVTNGILFGLKNIISTWRPDRIIVHGDTTTAMAASLAAYYAKISVAHVEAGLRSHNKYSPWPEEINRRIVSVITDIHFAPTEIARQNLIKENIAENNIKVTGNTVIDALFGARERILKDKSIQNELDKQFAHIPTNSNLILVTSHRRENLGVGLENICLSLLEIAKRQDVQIVFPVHLNPNVRTIVYNMLSSNKRIHLVEPLEYLPFVYLLNRCYLVMTDSGGIQEEAPSLKKPVLVMRDTTERPEAIAAGSARLVGTDKSTIIRSVDQLIDCKYEYDRMVQVENPYGDGLASKRIVEQLIKN